MNKFFKSLENFIDKAIPYLLIVLLVIIVVEIFYHDVAVKYHTVFEVLDWIIIAFFAIDLSFKFNRIRKIPTFFKKYWLEIIAVFPFFLVFRVLERFAGLYFAAQDLVLPQKILHEGVEAERLAKEARLVRESKLVRLFRPIARSPRLLKFTDRRAEKNFEKTLKKEEKRLEKEAGWFKKKFLMGLHFYRKP
tara:strand:+ start:1326 stop:1901 length:576 start_codon:yes stop_codon:yes gene_type:complete